MTRQSAKTQNRTASAPNHALAFERHRSLGPHLSVQRDATGDALSPATGGATGPASRAVQPELCLALPQKEAQPSVESRRRGVSQKLWASR